VTDVATTLRHAITAILDADSGIQTITGRSVKNCVPWRTGEKVTRPVILLQQLPITRIGGVGDNRRARFALTCLATGNGAQDKADALAERVEVALTQPNFVAQGANAFPLNTPTRTGAGPVDTQAPGENIARADLDLTLVVTT